MGSFRIGGFGDERGVRVFVFKNLKTISKFTSPNRILLFFPIKFAELLISLATVIPSTLWQMRNNFFAVAPCFFWLQSELQSTAYFSKEVTIDFWTAIKNVFEFSCSELKSLNCH
jgi:hypothetical protein